MIHPTGKFVNGVMDQLNSLELRDKEATNDTTRKVLTTRDSSSRTDFSDASLLSVKEDQSRDICKKLRQKGDAPTYEDVFKYYSIKQNAIMEDFKKKSREVSDGWAEIIAFQKALLKEFSFDYDHSSDFLAVSYPSTGLFSEHDAQVAEHGA